jgi:hypothetical protein
VQSGEDHVDRRFLGIEAGVHGKMMRTAVSPGR